MNITLRSVYKDRIGAVRALYELLRERSGEDDPYVNISHRALPPYASHVRFVRSHPYRAWYFVKVDGLIAGSVTITRLNEIGIVLSKDYRSKGIGRRALELLIKRHRPLAELPSHRPGRFVANVNPRNERSIRLFTSLGFKHVQNTYQL